MTHLVPPDAEERYVSIDQGRVRVLVGGQPGTPALPLVLVHGGGTDNAGISWFRSFTELGADRALIALDLPGFGGTHGIDPLPGPQPMADFVVRVAGELGIGRAVLVGVSMGGDVALNTALRHPQFVAGLVLISPGGLAPRVKGPITHRLAWLAAQLPDWLLLPLSRFANRFTGSVLKAIVVDPATLPDEVQTEFVREARAQQAGIAYGRYNQATLAPDRLTNDLSDKVTAITAPTLFFHGLDDPMVDPDDSRRAAKLMPNARLLLVPGIGHWGQLEAHELFTEHALRFLAEVDRPEPTPTG